MYVPMRKALPKVATHCSLREHPLKSMDSRCWV